MIIVDLEQGSQEWLDFKRDKVGGSEVATIIGLEPHGDTPRKLMERKKEGKSLFANSAMKRGTEKEPVARRMFNEYYGMDMKPAVVQSGRNPRLISSLDGLYHGEDGEGVKRRIILEIKCGSKEMFVAAKKGEIPEIYIPQLEHNCYVSGASYCWFVAYWEEPGCEEGEIACVLYDPYRYEKELLPKVLNFIDMYDKDIEPDMRKGDYQKYYHPRASDILKEYLDIDKEKKKIEKDFIEPLEARMKALKDELVEVGPQTNFILDEIKVHKVTPSTLDLEKMANDGIALHKYRKYSQSYWKIDAPRNGRSKSITC